MFVTRDLDAAKRYCNDRYYEQDTKKYGLMASSKAKNLKGYVDNSFNATKEVNSPTNLYRFNSYRVLLTRGREGFIIFIPPNSNELDEVYDLFVNSLGIKKLID